jgi:NAD(P)-dependent dehydrogenase (short-subunit alcohol dehydrogenase family)
MTSPHENADPSDAAGGAHGSADDGPGGPGPVFRDEEHRDEAHRGDGATADDAATSDGAAVPGAGDGPGDRSRAREARETLEEWSARTRPSLEAALEAAQRGLDQVRAATQEGLASAGHSWDAAREAAVTAAHERQVAAQERRAAHSARSGGRQRTYVVTGSAGGIGRAAVDRLRADGHRVFGVDVRDADLLADLSTPEGRTALGIEVEERCDGVVDGVIAVAGLVAPTPTTASVNFFGAKATLEELRPFLAGSPAPRAVVVSSLAAIGDVDDALVAACLDGDEDRAATEAERLAGAADASGNNLVYSSTKYAIARWVRRVAPTEEWAGAGIALNVVAPGVIETDMTRGALATPEGRAALEEGAPAPLNGPAAPAEVAAELLAYLAGELNSFVTGQVLFVDGGAEAIRRPERV